METVRKQQGQLLQFGEANLESRNVPYSDWVISTEEPDEIGDLVLLDGLDTSAWEQQNAPVLLAHDEKALVGNSKRNPADREEEPEIRVEGNRLVARCYHHIDTEDGRTALEWIRKGSVNGASISFRPKANGMRRATSQEMRQGIKRVFTNVSLFEWSIVPTPCNTNTELLSAVFPGEGSKGIPGLIRKSLSGVKKMAEVQNADTSTQTEVPPETESEVKKPAAALADAMLKSLNEHLKNADAAMNGVESEKATPILEKCMKDICSACGNMHKGMSELHPDLEMPKEMKSLMGKYGAGVESKDMGDGDEETDADDESKDGDEETDADDESKSLERINKALESMAAIVKRHDGEIEALVKRSA